MLSRSRQHFVARNGKGTYLDDRRALSLSFDGNWIRHWQYLRKRVRSWVRAVVLSWGGRQADNMLIRQDATVCEDETVGGSVCRLLLLSELACHFGQSVHTVIVPGAAERGQAA